MALTPVTDPDEISAAYKQLSANLKRDAKSFHKQDVGWPGGSGRYTVYWRPKERFWSMLESSTKEQWYWCSFGTEKPPQARSISIVCEINPPFRSYDRMLGGAFLRDNTGNVYLAHSGKIGGGKQGIGKSAFLQYWRGESKETVSWPDRLTTEMIVLGGVKSPSLSANILQFVREVEEFKSAVVSGVWNQASARLKQTFTPEFMGARKSYTITGVIQARSDHGRIIKALAALLKKHKLKFANDKNRDMYVLAKNNKVQYLFEAKTDATTTSIYQGIGQALYHTALYKPRPQPVLVMPGRPKKQSAKVLRALGIKLVSYTWKKNQPMFAGIDKVLR
jgi:hypothetical protein